MHEWSGHLSVRDSGMAPKEKMRGKQQRVIKMMLKEPGPGNVLGTEGP